MRFTNKQDDKSKKKDWRRAYPDRDSRNFDYSCKHGGNCSWCGMNRQFTNKRQSANNRIKDWE
jgi:hypothetical protein